MFDGTESGFQCSVTASYEWITVRKTGLTTRTGEVRTTTPTRGIKPPSPNGGGRSPNQLVGPDRKTNWWDNAHSVHKRKVLTNERHNPENMHEALEGTTQLFCVVVLLALSEMWSLVIG